jgi:hypothetical protein
MRNVEVTLEQIEAKLEAADEDVDALFQALGVGEDEEVEFFELPDEWSEEDAGFFHYVRGTYGLYRLSDSYLGMSMQDFEKAFPALVGRADYARATRAFARYLRANAFASGSLPSLFRSSEAMWDHLDELREKAPPQDVEELDLSIIEMLTRMTKESPFNDRDSIFRAFPIVRTTLSRLFVGRPSRQAALPWAIAGFWLDIDVLWTDEDLEEPSKRLAETGRQEMRRAAYTRALELEDGSFYCVGSHPGEDERKRQNRGVHFVNLLTQYETLRDEAGKEAVLARWGEELGAEAVEEALETARRNAEPAGSEPADDIDDEEAGRPSRAPARSASKPASKKQTAKKPAAKKPVAKKPAAKKPAAKEPGARKPAAKKSAAKKSAAKKPPARKPAAKKPAAKKPAAKKSAAKLASRSASTKRRPA